MFRSDRDPTDLAGMHTVKLGHEITGEVLYDQHKHVPYSKKYVPYDTLWLAKLPNDYNELSHRRYIEQKAKDEARDEHWFNALNPLVGKGTTQIFQKWSPSVRCPRFEPAWYGATHRAATLYLHLLSASRSLPLRV